ncbi:hypothetical protein [Methyloglobulus sp.]|uniref:hypothetical protein n=1 Tax=Methyloglobulus sp. TaxID=2518622 RepID=UPI0032B7C13C
MSKRESTKTYLQVAGYHNDTKAFMRLYCENRISKAEADKQFNIGQKKRENGVKCSCIDCNK